MKKTTNPFLLSLLLATLFTCQLTGQDFPPQRIRLPVDTIGFAQYAWQMDSLMARIIRLQEERPEHVSGVLDAVADEPWKACICPHDDYAYAGHLYPSVLSGVKAGTLIVFGVAHKARSFGLEDRIIFDSYDGWKAPYGLIRTSPVRQRMIELLPPDMLIISDTMQGVEHSVEALLPFLQHYDRNIEIVSILVPYMSFDRMQAIAHPLAEALGSIAAANGWVFGRDYALVISNDAVHYGDVDWGGSNYAPYGADSAGYCKAMEHEHEVIASLSDELNPDKLRQFCGLTVEQQDYKKYRWTWCGRYAVPFGLLTAFELNRQAGGRPLKGKLLGYSTSIEHPPIPVSDLGMGTTAPANIRHWVGYAALGYR
jgi:AmmeMemoRadiSam system protein B